MNRLMVLARPHQFVFRCTDSVLISEPIMNRTFVGRPVTSVTTLLQNPDFSQNARGRGFRVKSPGFDSWRSSRRLSSHVALCRECSNGFAFRGVYVEQKIQPSDAQDFRNSRVQHGQLDLRVPPASRYQDRTEGTNSATVNTSYLSHLQDNLPRGFEGLPCGAHECNRFRPVRQPPPATQYRDVLASGDLKLEVHTIENTLS
jgi:hypothetical protein